MRTCATILGETMEDEATTYEPPQITEIASLHELTLDTNKNYAPVSDGYTFQHQPINVS